MTAHVELRHASFTRPLPAFGSEPDVVLFGRRHLTAALSTTCEVEELPLTLPVAPRVRSGFWPAAFRASPRTAPTPRSSKRDASSIRSAFRRRMPLEGPPVARRFPDPSGKWDREARHRSHGLAAAIRLPASFRLTKRSRAAGLDPPSGRRLFAEGRGVGRTSFVDFCNRDVSRARPRFVRTPLHRALGRPCAQLLPDHARRSRDARAPGLRVAVHRVRRRAFARRREDPLHARPACAARTSRRIQDVGQPRSHGSGAVHESS